MPKNAVETLLSDTADQFEAMLNTRQDAVDELRNLRNAGAIPHVIRVLKQFFDEAELMIAVRKCSGMQEGPYGTGT